MLTGIVNFYKCGANGNERSVKYKNEDVVPVEYKFKKLFKEEINKYYNASKQNNIRVTYELTIRYYLKYNPDDKVPTLKQFYYWHQKIIQCDNKTSIVKRKGDRGY